MQHKNIIITLIKDHLVNTHLIHGLNALGWHSNDYHLHLSDIIFKLIGLNDEHEELFEAYLEWCNKMAEKDIFQDDEQLHHYATENLFRAAKGCTIKVVKIDLPIELYVRLAGVSD